MIDLASRPLPRKALSLRQPWCRAITNLGKDLENRRWWTNYRGDFLIHAAKAMTENEWEDACYFCLDRCDAHAVRRALGASWKEARESLSFGGIVGIARVVGVVRPCRPEPGLFEAKCPHKWHMPEQYGFVLEKVEPLPFVPCKGQRFFFEVDDGALCDLDQAIRCTLPHAEVAHG